MAPILQHQARPSVPLTKAAQSLGWMQRYEPPRAPLARHHLQSSTAIALTPLTLPPVIAGEAWQRPFEQPYPAKFKPDLHIVPTNPALVTPPVPISGMAWARPFEQPSFGPKVFNLDDGLVEAYPPINIAGMAWSKAFDQPAFRSTVYLLDDGYTEPFSPASLPPTTGMWALSSNQRMVRTIQHQGRPGMPARPPQIGPTIAGMAWHRSFDLPGPPSKESWIEGAYSAFFAIPPTLISGAFAYSSYQKITRVIQHQKGPTVPLSISAPISPIVGQPWSQPFDQPRFSTSFKAELQQTQMQAPPLGMVVVMASASDDQPLTINKQWWLSPSGPALSLSAANLPVGVSGMAWLRQFDEPPPKKPVVMPRLEAFVVSPSILPAGISGMAWHHNFDQPPPTKPFLDVKADYFVPIPATLPPMNAGIPWLKAFDQPAPTKPVVDMTASTYAEFPFVIATISGMAWMRPFEPPLFRTTVRAEDHSGQYFAPPLPKSATMAPPSTSDQPLPVKGKEAWLHPPVAFAFKAFFTPISGMAWHRQYDEPPPRKTRADYLRGDAFIPLAATLPTQISGMAWWAAFSQPAPTKKTIDVRSEMFVPLASTLPPGISGMAWYTPFEQPTPARLRSDLWKLEAFVASPDTLSVGISGMAWQQPFSEPRPVTPKVEQYSYGGSFLRPQANPAPVSGMAWNQPYDQPSFKGAQPWVLATTTTGSFIYKRRRSDDFEFILIGVYNKRQ